MKMLVSSIFNIDKFSIVHIEIGQIYLCKYLASRKEENNKFFFDKAVKEKANSMKYLKNPVLEDNIIDFFLKNNPNTESWIKKSNKLVY
jgi:hypothetical protein